MTKRIRNRAEFSQKTRELTAQRAGYKCSFPNCNRVTVGPNKHPDKLSCYKALHEARIAHKLTGVPTPFGWVDSMKIHTSSLFVDDIEFYLAKLTLITGGNSVGKTALCQWLASVAHAHYLEGWAKVPIDRKRLFFGVSYHDPEPHTVSVSFLSDGCPEYKLDTTPTTIPTTPLKIIYPQYIPHLNNYREEQDDLNLISGALNLHPYELKALCDDIATNGSDNVKSAWFEENDEGCYLIAEVEGNELSPCRFHDLSDSQRDRVIMELGILAANQFAAMCPTLLILHSGNSSGFWRFDKDRLKLYSDFLGSPTCKFQTVVSMIPERVNSTKSVWSGWKIIELEGEPPSARFRSGIKAHYY